MSEAAGPPPSDESPARPAARRVFPSLIVGTNTLVVARLAAIGISGLVGWYAYTLVRDDQSAINRAIWLYGAVLLLMTLVAWDGSRPVIHTWPARVKAYARAHPVELALLAVIVGVAAFVRLFEYGTLPPSGYIYFEEHINGGVAHRILEGERPYSYPLVRYSTALGMHIFGPTTLGMRAALFATGIAVIIPFYLLMRELVAPPAALMAAGLFACSKALADVTVYFQVPMFAVVVMVWMMIRGLKTRNAVWFVPATALAVIVSHEYEAFKPVPLFAACFLGFVLLRGLLWPMPRPIGQVRDRVRIGAPFVMRVAVVIAVIVPVGIGPMVAQAARGENIYFSSLDRQQADRENRGTPGFISPDWEKQLKRSVEVFTPWVKANYPAIGSIPTRGVIDRATSVLIWIGVIGGVLFFWRGYRAMFIGWFAGGMIMSALLLSNWAAWKLVGWLPPVLVLAGFFADDLLRLAERYRPRAGPAVVAAIAGVVAVAFVLNVRAIAQNADDENVLKEWGNTPSQLFSVCDNLRKRPDDTYAIVSQRIRGQWGFVGGDPPEGIEEQRKLWGDFLFVCSELRGMALAELQEVWPLAVEDGRPYTLIEASPKDEVEHVMASIARAMPELGEPERKVAPGGGFEVLIYDATHEEINARQGLLLEWLDAAGDRVGEATVWPLGDSIGDPPPGATRYRLSGLVYLSGPVTGGLVPEPADASTTVEVHGQSSYAEGEIAERPFASGWHLVEIEGRAGAQGPARLAWRSTGGSETRVGPEDAFALADMNVWWHLRQLQEGDAPPYIVQRYDFQPHFSSLDGVRVGPTTPLPAETKVLIDYYQGYWDAPVDGDYTFNFPPSNQRVEVIVDGKVVVDRPRSGGVSFGRVTLTRGEHMVEVRFSDTGAAYIGGTIWFTDPETREPRWLEARPFPRRASEAASTGALSSTP